MAVNAQALNYEGAGVAPDLRINDVQFMHDLKWLKELRSFLIQEAINISPGESDPLSFGTLNLLRYDISGRAPTEEEWSKVELFTQALFRLLTEPLRRRCILGGIPMWVSALPIMLALLAVAALFGATRSAGPIQLLCYLGWLIFLGAIGSVAFIGMNALSVQQDITFDLTNRRLMILRIALGSLFGLVLTLPFGVDRFKDFILGITGVVKSIPADPGKTVTNQALLLLLPFILGFSTSLGPAQK
jgi:hypothetical protein